MLQSRKHSRTLQQGLKDAMPTTELQQRRLNSVPVPVPFILSNDSCSFRNEPNVSDNPQQIFHKFLPPVLRECSVTNYPNVCVVITNIATINETIELDKTDSS